jgi:DNA-binding MarR family transcriptional regulator
VVGLVDRLERAGHVERKPHATDRRFNRIVLTSKGQRLEQRVEQSYFEEVDKMMNVLNASQKKALIQAVDRIRQYILDYEP